jgi:prevent-host-death family protein
MEGFDIKQQAKNTTTNVVSALTARTQLGQIMQRARENDERFVVDRRGEPQVVIMGIEDFIKTMAPESAVLSAIRADAGRKGTNRLTMRQIDAEIGRYRREQSKRKGRKKTRKKPAR